MVCQPARRGAGLIARSGRLEPPSPPGVRCALKGSCPPVSTEDPDRRVLDVLDIVMAASRQGQDDVCELQARRLDCDRPGADAGRDDVPRLVEGLEENLELVGPVGPTADELSGLHGTSPCPRRESLSLGLRPGACQITMNRS